MTTERPTSQQAPDWLEAALAVANIPTLTCILVQMTGDRKWIEGDYVPSRPRGMDDNDTGGLTAELQTEIRLAAHEQISAWLSGQPLAIPDPDDALLVEMMGVSLREDIPSRYAPMIRHELGLDADTSRLTQTAPGLQLPAVPGAALAGLDIPNGYLAVIIGAGISGLCAAINFAAAGIPFTILERNHHLGGVWFENKYPGAACDVPSHLYSFSFASYDWSRFFCVQ
jgi:4-hydroxyacetophenone monooxygenase